MRRINLLPEPNIIERYSKPISIICTLIVVNISIYWLSPYLSPLWKTPTPSTASSNAKFANFSIQKLKIIGYLRRETSIAIEQNWSVVQSPDGETHPIKIGDYLGYESAKVTDIRPTGIYLVLSHQAEPVFIHAISSTHP